MVNIKNKVEEYLEYINKNNKILVNTSEAEEELCYALNILSQIENNFKNAELARQGEEIRARYNFLKPIVDDCREEINGLRHEANALIKKYKEMV